MTSQLQIATNDRRLAAGEEPALGSHLVTPRFGFTHHGIYVGCGRVIHYGALVHGLHGGPVEDVALARFTHGHTLWVRPSTARFDCEEVIRRARSRIGENSYHLLSNNCEHFCEWCLRGEHRSEQVERALVLPRRLARGFGAAAARCLSRFDVLQTDLVGLAMMLAAGAMLTFRQERLELPTALRKSAY